jgi:predicted nucleotidyltransferase
VELSRRWPQLDLLLDAARDTPSTQVWMFGSATRSNEARDLDVLLVYEDRSLVVALRKVQPWEEFEPPCHLIAMTPLEVVEYDFIKTTGAVRLI